MLKAFFGFKGVSQRTGHAAFSLIEVMVAMVLLLVGLLAFFALQLTAIRVNDANKRFIIAKEAALQGVEEVKTMGYSALINPANDLTASPGLGYVASYGSLPATYQMSGIDTSCASPYTYCIYKGVLVVKNVKGNVVNYYHTLKLSVAVNYLSYPILQRCDMMVYWMSHGNLVKTDYVFFVEQKPS